MKIYVLLFFVFIFYGNSVIAQKNKVKNFVLNFKEEGLLQVDENQSIDILIKFSNESINYYSYQYGKIKKTRNKNESCCVQNLNYCLKIFKSESKEYYNFEIISGSIFKGHFELLGENRSCRYNFYNFFYSIKSL